MAPEAPAAGISVPAELSQVRRLADWLRSACEQAGLGPMATVDLELAMVEAANNIVEHGSKAGTGEIALQFAVDRGVALVTLTDSGFPVPQGLYDSCRDAALDAEEGRGVGIVRACVDAVHYVSANGTNRLTLTKLLL